MPSVTTRVTADHQPESQPNPISAPRTNENSRVKRTRGQASIRATPRGFANGTGIDLTGRLVHRGPAAAGSRGKLQTGKPHHRRDPKHGVSGKKVAGREKT